jgi:hypothetical protein
LGIYDVDAGVVLGPTRDVSGKQTICVPGAPVVILHYDP